MSKIKRPTYIVEVPLRTTESDKRNLSIRLNAARNLYNACLGELLSRMSRMKADPDYDIARAMPKGDAKRELFAATAIRHGFTKTSSDAFAIKTKNACWIGDHLGAHETQKTGEKAFNAVKEHSLGKRGRPRFKPYNRLHSIEGKSNAAGIRWREGKIEWGILSLQGILPPKGKDPWLESALEGKVKYCRVIHRHVKGDDRWSVQLMMDGTAPRKTKHNTPNAVVGLDVGPSTIAAVGENKALLEKLCAALEQPWKESRRVLRAMDRSRRATNPGNYNPDGTFKTGPKKWIRSEGYKKQKDKLSEIERRLADERKRSHGELANKILSLGKQVKTERLSYISFQKNYGRSVKVRSPGMLVSTIKRKAESAGGSMDEFPTRTTKLSQTCHCGLVVRKPLSLRTHECPCGVGPVQRDLYSGFLARHVKNDKLDHAGAERSWPGAEPLLKMAWSSFNESASGRRISASPRRKAPEPIAIERERAKRHEAPHAPDTVRVPIAS